MTMRYAAVAAAIVAATTLWIIQNKQPKSNPHILQGTVHYNTVSDKHELRVATNKDDATFIHATHLGLECMSKAGYTVRIYTPNTLTQHSIPVILASASQATFAEDCTRCRVRSRIQYTTATKQEQTTTIHWDQIVCPDEFAQQTYTERMPLTD